MTSVCPNRPIAGRWRVNTCRLVECLLMRAACLCRWYGGDPRGCYRVNCSRCKQLRQSMPAELMSQSWKIVWTDDEFDCHSDCIDSGGEEDSTAEDDVVPIDYSRVSDDLLRLVRRTYHLYTAYRIMEPKQHYRSHSKSKWLTPSLPLHVSQHDEDNSDIETYAKQLKKMCNSGTYDEDEDSDAGSELAVSENSASNDVLFEGNGPAVVRCLFEPDSDDVFVSDARDADSPQHDLNTKQQKGAVLENLMKDLSNVSSRLGDPTKTSNCNSDDFESVGKDSISVDDNQLSDAVEEQAEQQAPTNVRIPLDGCQENRREIVTRTNCELRQPLLAEECPSFRSVVDGSFDTILSSSPCPQASARPPQIDTKGEGDDTISEQRVPHSELVDAGGGQRHHHQQRRPVRKHRKSRLTADRELALAGDEVRSRRLTRRASARRNAGVGVRSNGGGLSCFVVLERLEDVMTKTTRQIQSSTRATLLEGSDLDGVGEDAPLDHEGKRPKDGDEFAVDVDQIVIDDESYSKSGSSTFETDSNEVGGESQEGTTSVLNCHSYSGRRNRNSESRSCSSRTGCQTPESCSESTYSNLDASEPVSSPPPSPNESPSTNSSPEGSTSHSEDDSDPGSFADLFGNPSKPSRGNDGNGQRLRRPAIFASSLACTFMSVASAILSARKRAEASSTPCRRSGRMASRDSGLPDSEDSRGSIVDSESRLDAYWTRRRKYWEVTDIRDEVRELLGFVPDDSPPGVVAPMHNSSVQKVAVPTSQGTRRRSAARALKKSVSSSPAIDSGGSTEPKAKRARRSATMDATNGIPLIRDNTVKVTVSKRSGRNIRPPEHMDM